MEESKKEFLGITPASLLAAFGALITIFPVFFDLGLILRNAVGIIALGMIITGIVLNRRKGLDEKWRRINYRLHRLMFLLAIGIIIMYNCRWGF